MNKSLTLGLLAVLAALCIPGCASLSKSQMESVKSFSTSCDNFTKYPSVLFVELAEVRSERGCYYTASLSDPLSRVKELEAVEKARSSDMLLAKKVDLSLDILKTYRNALKSLCGDERYKSTGREFRSLGKSLDSLVKRYNQLDLSDPLPLGVGRVAGKIVGYGSEVYLRNVQTKLVKEFVVQADTLVAGVVASLVKTLSGDQVKNLIDNETEGLKSNYMSYVKACGGDFAGDKEYLSLLTKVRNLSELRTKITQASKALAKAHGKIAKEMASHKKLKQVYTELEELDDIIYALNSLVEKL